jgi:hypothetical protein
MMFVLKTRTVTREQELVFSFFYLYYFIEHVDK